MTLEEFEKQFDKTQAAQADLATCIMMDIAARAPDHPDSVADYEHLRKINEIMKANEEAFAVGCEKLRESS